MIPLIILLAAALYFLNADERRRLLRGAVGTVQTASAAAIKWHNEADAFRDALRARTRLVVVTPALAAVTVWMFLAMLFAPGSLSDPDTLVSWGASFGPLTTNGEWWRLVTAMLVHGGFLALVVNVAALVAIGLVLERLVGHFAFAVVYISAGVIGGLVSLSAHPVGVRAGAAPALFGLCGLLNASVIWGLVYRSDATISLTAWKRLGPPLGIFVLYHILAGGFDSAELAGLFVGFIGGVALELGVEEGKPDVRRIAATAGAACLIAIGCAIPLSGMTDVRRELAQVVAVESEVAGAYDAAVRRFRNGQITPEALMQVIDDKIMPPLRAVRARLKVTDGVPPEQQVLLASADEYLRLRDESWRLRLEGLRKSNMLKLREAERVERASFDALNKIKAVTQDVTASAP